MEPDVALETKTPRIDWRSLRHNKAAAVALVVFGVILLSSIFAPCGRPSRSVRH